MKLRTFFTISLTVVASITTDAQVTIGTNEAPLSGALLQLKNQTGITGNGANATKGLGLPRVALEQFKKLEPCAETTVANMASHTGLVVYNTTNSGVFSPGTYSWDGTSWQRLNGDGYQGFGPWYEVGSNPAKASSLNTTDSYLKAKAVIGGDAPIGNAQLSVIGDAMVDGKMGIGIPPQNNASLSLKGTDKGFLLPKVQLVDTNDATTIPVTVADKGMFVYHIGSTNMPTEGIYYWNGATWSTYIDRAPDHVGARSNIENLKTDVESTQGTSQDPGLTSRKLPFDIAIKERGSYAFQLRLYGPLHQLGLLGEGRNVLYFFVYKNNVMIDAAEVNIFLPNKVGTYLTTYTLGLTASDCEAGDVIELRFSHYKNWAGGNNMWRLVSGGPTNAARTSMVYWKL